MVDPRNPSLVYSFYLSERLDEKNEVDLISFKSDKLGELIYSFDNQGSASLVKRSKRYF